MLRWLSLLLVLTPSVASAQDTIVLRPDALLAGMSGSIASGLERRTQRHVVVEGVLDDATPRDLGGPIGMARVADHIRMFAVAPSGAMHVTEVGAARDDRTTTRVIVVALTGFLESLAADVVVPEDDTPPAPVFEEYALPLDGSALDDLARPYREQSYALGFVAEVRDRVTYATQRDSGASWIGGSFGVCFGTWWCVQLDVDVMLPPEEHGIEGGTLTYAPGTVGIGGRFLPLEAGPVRGGVGVDATTRVARTRVGDGPDDWAFSGGMRLLADVSVELVAPVFLALEAGADIAFNAFRYVHAGRVVMGGDVVSLWTALAIRVGPF